MIIAIDGSRAFLKQRTGIEEYSYQVISHLRNELNDGLVIIYIRADQEVDFELPSHWRVKKLWAPRFWTHIRLSLEMILHRPDVLFVPAHTVPLVHPAHTVVVIHGLEYEFYPKAYSLWSRLSMRAMIAFSCRVAQTIICVSENTKRDVMRLYGTSEEKIEVIYEGYRTINNSGRTGFVTQSGSLQFKQKVQVANLNRKEDGELYNQDVQKNGEDFFQDHLRTRSGRKKILPHSFVQEVVPYFLFIGRLEERKNITRCIEAFEIAKEKYSIPYRLVLVGKPGFGYKNIQDTIAKSAHKDDIIESGYVNEEEKWELMRNAEVFLFTTLYEGFGIPILEAQSMSVPVITSNTSSLPEVAGGGAVLVNPKSVSEIALAMQSVISNQELKSAILQKGLENVKRFSWEKCAQEIGYILKK